MDDVTLLGTVEILETKTVASLNAIAEVCLCSMFHGFLSQFKKR